MRKSKKDEEAISRQRRGMRLWGRRNARLYDLWATLLAAAGYRRMIRSVSSRLPETGRTVDIGCGSGEFLRIVRRTRPGLGVIGCDLAPEFLALARRQLPGTRLVCADAERLPMRDGGADVAVSFGVLGHLLSIEPAIGEIARIVRNGGKVAVWTRIDNGPSRLVARLFGWLNRGVVFRLHSPASVRAALERSGIRIEDEETVAGGRLWVGTRGPA
jgi:ubiquinone/menaquinone biosynthesis C-methylase UbiE